VAVAEEQAKWAVLLRMRDQAPGSVWFDVDPGRWCEADIDADVALRAFSTAVSYGSVTEREAAAEALGLLLDPRAVSPLIRALRDEAVEVRRAAARSFESCIPAPERAVDPLVDALADHDPHVRRSLAIALTRAGHPRGIRAAQS
jgi:HEAT repeat protein